MLKTVDLTGKFDKNAPCAMLLGGFDGVHAGHRRLLEKAKTYGLPVGIMTIDGGKHSKNLFTFAEREEIFRKEGADFAFELPFPEIRDMAPAEFLRILTDTFRPRAFVCGSDFRFGKDAEGTPDFIKASTRVSVDVEELVCVNGEKVSATAVKRLLGEGDVSGAARFLGGEFFLKGEVVRDRQVGRTIHFPTANVLYPKEKFPLKKAVYETRASVNGKEYKCITNFGSRPTFDDEKVVTETYLDGFDGDLYGREIEVRFVRFLRDIKKFNGAEALKKQLETDIRRVRNGD